MVAQSGPAGKALRIGHVAALFAIEAALAVGEAVAAQIANALRLVSGKALPMRGAGCLAVDVEHVLRQGRGETTAGRSSAAARRLAADIQTVDRAVTIE